MKWFARLASVVVAVGLGVALACHRGASRDAGPVEIPPLKVLFIGNSYTYVNDLPGMFRSLVSAAGGSITVDSLIEGGATLEGLWGKGAPAKIAQGGWTHVVIQGQSVEPCLNPTNFLAYAGKFAEAARAVGAVPVFYETWPRRAGDAVYQEPWSGGSPSAMQECLRSAYSSAASSGEGVMAPAGDAWMDVLAKRSDIVLHQSDGSHPTASGTYLTAAVMFSVIAHAPAGDVLFNPNGVNQVDRQWLAERADEVASP